MNIQETIQKFKADFSSSSDLLVRELVSGGRKCVLFFIEGESDKKLLEQDIIQPLVHAQCFNPPYVEALNGIVFYSEKIVPVNYNEAKSKVAQGDIALFIDGNEDAYLFSLRDFEKRSIAEPPTASVLKGPREGFIEEIKTNISMIRRRIKSPELVVKMMEVGRFSATAVAVLFVNGIADRQIVEDIQKKIEAIDIDGIVDSSYIATLISKHKYSIFNQTGTTEKPDVATAKLLEGRIAIIVDGSPIVITLPYIMLEDLQDGYDYYSNDWRTTIIRFFRIVGALLTTVLPGAYVALQTYHIHLLPLKFLMTIMSATSGIPFPPAIEMLFVLVLFEILNQASIRMPRFMGISLSVVGAIVLGDTAVKAGLISSPAVLIIALSAIGIFCVPDQVGTTSILRLVFLCASAVLGFLGMIIVMVIVIGYLAGLDDFGSPYLAPYAPRISPDLKDGLLKQNLADMTTRPYSISTDNRTRMQNSDINEEN